MERGIAAVARARALIGTRFVAQGRDAASGVDCAGLAIHAYGIEAREVPDDYRLSGDHRPMFVKLVSRWFRRVSWRRLVPGDLLLLRPAPSQWHLGIWTGEGLLHADARRRSVIERPGVAEWPVAAAYRARVRKKKKG